MPWVQPVCLAGGANARSKQPAKMNIHSVQIDFVNISVASGETCNGNNNQKSASVSSRTRPVQVFSELKNCRFSMLGTFRSQVLGRNFVFFVKLCLLYALVCEVCLMNVSWERKKKVSAEVMRTSATSCERRDLKTG